MAMLLSLSFGACCLDVRTRTFRQRRGFPLNHQELFTLSRASQISQSMELHSCARSHRLPGRLEARALHQAGAPLPRLPACDRESPWTSQVVVVGKEFFPIFACCGLVGFLHLTDLTAKIRFFAPLPTSTKRWPFRAFSQLLVWE